MIRSVVVGCGHALPPKIISNDDLAKEMDTNDEWITARTGIRQRHWVTTETTSDLATLAAQEALIASGIAAEDIDMIVVATTTPDKTFPSTATIVQANLGAKNAFAFDIQAVCSGFVYGLSVVDNFIKAGQVKTVLLIGAETMSRILDPEDRGTSILFGDGAGAIVLRAGTPDEGGVLSTHLFSDGSLEELLYVDNGPGQENPGHGFIRMKGKEVFRHAVEKIGDSVVKALAANQMTVADVDWFVPHQANIRIINSLCHFFDLPIEKVIVTIDKYANTSAASIPLTLYEGVKDGRIKKGDMVLIEALGGGMTWGSGVIKW